MWPLERRGDVVRVGRQRVERWTHEASGLVLTRQVELQPADAPSDEALEHAIREVLSDAPRRIDVIVESAWLPVMLIRPGRELWARSGVEALARHRLIEIYGDGGIRDGTAFGMTSPWEITVDHRPGDEVAIAYGLPHSLRSTLVRSATDAGVRVQSLQPALAWGWRRAGAQRDGWRVWLEQDRALVCHLARGRLDALNAGAAVPKDAAGCRRLVSSEAVRQGLAVPDVTVLTGWQQSFAGSSDGSIVVSSVVAMQGGAPQGGAGPLGVAA